MTKCPKCGQPIEAATLIQFGACRECFWKPDRKPSKLELLKETVKLAHEIASNLELLWMGKVDDLHLRGFKAQTLHDLLARAVVEMDAVRTILIGELEIEKLKRGGKK